MLEIGSKHRHIYDGYVVMIEDVAMRKYEPLIYFTIGRNKTHCDESYFVRYFKPVESKEEILKLIKALEL